MILQSLELADRVDIKPSDTQDIYIHCDHPQVPKDETNLAYRAAKLMCDVFPDVHANYGGVSIRMEKNIPVVRLNSCSGELVGIPNIFSPNGDGVNDELLVFTTLPDIDLFQVYDRWGNELFKTSDKSIGWDGNLGNETKQPNTYVYRIVFTCPSNNEQVQLIGDVTLVR